MYNLPTLLALASLGACTGPFLDKAKPYSQDIEDNYNILKYTAWEGPWTQRRGVGLNRNTPVGCRVDQVVMLHRHGERYPSPGDGAAQDAAYQKIVANGKKGQLKGSLEFVNYWKPYADGKTPMDNQESTFGAYAGVLGAYWNGVDYRRRYGHLYDGESILPIFSSGYERIASTARKFGQGFLGYNYTDLAAVQIIPETDDQGANTLVTNGCDASTKENPTKCPLPANMTMEDFENVGWMLPEFQKIANRLNKENNLNLTNTDAYHLMATAAFELNIRGDSPWVEVFTDEEWIAFEYYESSNYYCFYGPGSTATPYRGSVFLNATRTLLEQGPEEVGSLFFSFAHDTDITPVVSLLGFASPEQYDPTQVTFHSLWDVTDIVPQNSRIVFERLVCESEEELDEEERKVSKLSSKYPLAFDTNATDAATYASHYQYAGGDITVDTLYGNLSAQEVHAHHANTTAHKSGKENIYIRIVLNEAVAPIPGCSSGPGKSCKLSDFDKLVDKAIAGNDYYENCVAPVNSEWPSHVEFFWNWNATNANNFDPSSLPYQAGLLDSNGKVVPSHE